MKACYVCGTDLEDFAVSCAQCGAERILLEQLLTQTKRHDFLFSGKRRSVAPKETKTPPPNRKAPPVRKTPSRQKQNKESVQPVVKPAKVFDSDPFHMPTGMPAGEDALAPLDPSGDDRILARDTGIDDQALAKTNRNEAIERPKLPGQFPWRIATHALDVALVMLLDYLIFQLMLTLSGRSLVPLLNFSLVPIFFVLLSFTVLYFWLFMTLFEQTLGHMLLKMWLPNQTNKKSG